MSYHCLTDRFFRCTVVAVLALCGCGTTQWSDTKRTATEQLLLSDAIDRSVSRLDLRPLAGQSVYLDRAPLKDTVDENYLVSVLRQHMLASGCLLREKPEQADYIVEARAGAVGTSRHDVLYGLPSTDLPVTSAVPVAPARIPEIPIAKKTDQQGVAKIALFAYSRVTGIPLWQSGNERVASTVKDTWILGIGPFEQGTIHNATRFAGDEIRPIQLNSLARSGKMPADKIWVDQTIQFNSPESIAWQQKLQQARLASLPHRPADVPHKEAQGSKAATPQTTTKADFPAAKPPPNNGPPLSPDFPHGTIEGIQAMPFPDGRF